MLAFKISKRLRGIIYSVSLLIGAGIGLFVTFVYPGYNVHPDYDTLLVVTVIAALIPPSAIDLIHRRWAVAVDAKLSVFIRDMAESMKTGMSFTRSIEHAARLDYGPLTTEIRKMVALLGWGIPYDEALDQLAQNVDTPLVYRTVTLLKEIGNSGGRLFEILDDVHTHVKEIQDLEQDRRRQMSPYMMVIYASFGVYLFVVLVLFTTFFAQISQVVKGGSTPFLSGINPQLYYVWFFHMSVIEALMGGFVAGKMSEGVISAGLKHVLVLLTISIVVFVFFIQPTIVV